METVTSCLKKQEPWYSEDATTGDGNPIDKSKGWTPREIPDKFKKRILTRIPRENSLNFIQHNNLSLQNKSKAYI